MKLLLIEAVNPRSNSYPEFFSFGLGYISSYLRQKIGGIEIKIVNSDITGTLERFKPDIVGISAVTQNYNMARIISKLCKAKGHTVIVGGSHITTLPDNLDASVDIGVIGEGEETMLEILLYIKKYGLDKERLSAINGIVYRDRQGGLTVTDSRKPVSSLDTFPYPDRDKLGLINKKTMFTSRGCPYRCSFCSSTRLWPQVRYFSAEYVVNEIKLLYERYDSRYIEIWDDLFIANKPRFRRIINLLREMDLLGRIEFLFAIRANLVDEELIQNLKEMNVVLVTMGLESMSQRVLGYLKPDGRVEQNQQAVEMLHNKGIEVGASFIVGSPEEEEEDILKTLSFIKSAPLDTATIYLLTPFPGTLVWDYAKSKGLVSENMDWDKLDVNFKGSLEHNVILSEHLSRERLEYYLKLFHEESRRKNRILRFRNRLALLKKAALNPRKVLPYLKGRLFFIYNQIRTWWSVRVLGRL